MIESYDVIYNYAVCIDNRLPANVPRGTFAEQMAWRVQSMFK